MTGLWCLIVYSSWHPPCSLNIGGYRIIFEISRWGKFDAYKFSDGMGGWFTKTATMALGKFLQKSVGIG